MGQGPWLVCTQSLVPSGPQLVCASVQFMRAPSSGSLQYMVTHPLCFIAVTAVRHLMAFQPAFPAAPQVSSAVRMCDAAEPSGLCVEKPPWSLYLPVESWASLAHHLTS